MKVSIATKRLLGVGALIAFTAASAAAQQNYPNRPIGFIVPNAPGGATSIAARLVGEKLTAAWGQQVIIDNRPGGNNIVAGLRQTSSICYSRSTCRGGREERGSP